MDKLHILTEKRRLARSTLHRWAKSMLDDPEYQTELVEERVRFWSHRVCELTDRIAEWEKI